MALTLAEKDQFFKLLCKMSIMDAAEMKSRVEDELDIEFKISTETPNQLPLIPALAPRTGGTKPEPVYDITLANPGTQRVAVMKLLRELFSLTLLESKEAVDGSPTLLAEGLDEDKAKRFTRALAELGATPKTKPSKHRERRDV